MKYKYIKPESKSYYLNMQCDILQTSAHADGDVTSTCAGDASDNSVTEGDSKGNDWGIE